jgi:two-component system chemotaxis response regulator CheB
VDEDVGGKHGRKVYFNSQTREVKIRPIGARHRDYSERKIRVLIVDDSGLVRKILRDIIHSAPEFEVCGEAADAFEARDMILEEDPDVLSLDIIMPRLDGLEFLEKIMKYKPIPTVIVSTIAKANSPVERRAKKIGAVAVVDKDALALYTGIEKAKGMYLPALKAASMSIL